MIAAVWWVATNQYGALQDFKSVVNGALPIGAFLIGLFIVWLEMDELRIGRELGAEEKKKKK